MAVRLGASVHASWSELRIHEAPFRVRGYAGSTAVVDAPQALLVWEPRRVTPSYAVPRAALAGAVRDAGAPRGLTPAEQHRPVLDPSVPFDAHTAPGRVVELDTEVGAVGGFIPDDPALRDHVVVDFGALNWWEADEPVFAHPRDPFHRIDVRQARVRLRMERDGVPVVATDRARLLAETMLPVRWYVPADDVLVPLDPSGTVTWCAYKGRATYRSAVLSGKRLDDLFWTYEQPLSDGRDVRGLLGVYADRLEVTVEGVPVPPAATPGAP